MNVTLDADILFNAVSGHSTKTLLHHIVNAGHSLFVPLTVLGEVMLVSMSDDKKYEAMQDIVFLCRELFINFQIPSQKLRQCCVCIDDVDRHNRLQFTDKTHLGYAAASASDYFLTTDKLLRRFRYPCETVGGCGSAPICISPDDMRGLL